MIDEATLELLSRHLDGDLEPAERRLLEARLEAEPSLAAELAGLERLRDRLGELAARDEPPAELDAALEPLRRSAPPAPGLRPAYRWLALAATLLVGATVTFRVAQRASTPTAPSRAAPGALKDARDAPYQLRPLPTSSVPEDQELLGAADHLLARPLPTPMLPEPPVHTAIGPLTESERQVAAPTGGESQRTRRDLDRLEATAQAPPRSEAVADAGQHPADGAKPEADEVSRMAAARERTGMRTSAQPAPAAGRLEDRSQGVAPRQGTLTLSTETGPVVIRFATRQGEGGLRRPVRVSVRAGLVVAVWEPSTNEAPPLPETLVNELTGRSVGAVADGEYAAAISVD